ncbi:methyltransferase domain-containing protein [Streptomyces sp. NPDC005407]|uniref:methyltransferase domain-containing protein n=1 Tax=Streptomyces sp. NPDC005407 TaxID=3155340 RepID=UPI0033BE908D
MTTSSSQDFQQRIIGDAATAVRALTVALGERLGLYAALADSPSLTAPELAERAGIQEMYAREWLHAQVSGGYVETDPSGTHFRLPEEHVPVLAGSDSDVFTAPFFSALKALYGTEDSLVDAYRNGGGVGWDEHDGALDDSLGRFFLTGYRAHLVDQWIPSLEEVPARLAAGGRVADVGCGPGHSTFLMAEAFPRSRFVGFDYSSEAIAQARRIAAGRQLPQDRVHFTTSAGNAFTGGPYDLITSFNCVHDIGDPDAVARHVRSQLADDGTWMIVEPNADPDVHKNTHPAGRLFMALSAVMCLPAAAAQKGPRALGNHSGEETLRGIALDAGFTRWRRADATPVSAVYEARP